MSPDRELFVMHEFPASRPPYDGPCYKYVNARLFMLFRVSYAQVPAPSFLSPRLAPPAPRPSYTGLDLGMSMQG